jgi:hypothetical protein
MKFMTENLPSSRQSIGHLINLLISVHQHQDNLKGFHHFYIRFFFLSVTKMFLIRPCQPLDCGAVNRTYNTCVRTKSHGNWRENIYYQGRQEHV